MFNSKQCVGGALLALALTTGCADDGANAVSGPLAAMGPGNPAGDVVYEQVEFLGNPLVSEVTIVKANHDAYNRTMPYASATFRPQTEQFITGVAGRPQAYAQTVSGVLYPDMLIVDASKPTSTAGWLTWALGSPYFSGNLGWGGRKLSDDVVDVGLIAIFSNNPLESRTGSCAPGALPLCTDNVPANDKPFMTSFPYLASPTL